MMSIMLSRSKRKDVLRGTLHVIKRFEVDVFVKVTARKSTTKAPTGQAVYDLSRLVLLIAARIERDSQNVHRWFEIISKNIL